MAATRTSRIHINGLGTIKVYHPASPFMRSSLHHDGCMTLEDTDDRLTQVLAHNRRVAAARTKASGPVH